MIHQCSHQRLRNHPWWFQNNMRPFTWWSLEVSHEAYHTGNWAWSTFLTAKVILSMWRVFMGCMCRLCMGDSETEHHGLFFLVSIDMKRPTVELFWWMLGHWMVNNCPLALISKLTLFSSPRLNNVWVCMASHQRVYLTCGEDCSCLDYNKCYHLRLSVETSLHGVPLGRHRNCFIMINA